MNAAPLNSPSHLSMPALEPHTRASLAAPGQAAGPLFVLLKAPNNTAPQAEWLTQRLLAAFPQAVVHTLSLCPVPGGDPALRPRIEALQQQEGLAAQATALVGLEAGADAALALAHAADGLAGRVLAFGAGAEALTGRPPALSTLHLLNGGSAPAMAQACQAHAAAGADLTFDALPEATGAADEALIALGLDRLRSTIPARTWAEAMRSAGAPS